MASEKIVSCEAENLENGKVKLTIKVGAERFREGLQYAYGRNKQYFNIPGFRKGKAPRKLIEQSYGRDVFHEEALNFVLPDAYEAALEKHALEPVYKPEIEPGEINETDGIVVFATVQTRPTAEIQDYYGLTFPKNDFDATEEDIQNALRAEQEKNSRQVSSNDPAKIGDVVTINFKGFIDGEPFEGGAGEDHDLKLGSGQFIPGFEDQLVGKIPGDDVHVNVNFPDEYHHEEFAGKAAVFEVEILDVKTHELPEINDEFAEDVSEFDSLAEWRDDLAKKITENKKLNTENKKRSHLTKKLIALSKAEIPEEMYLARLDDMMYEFSQQLAMRGIELESYMRFTQMSEEMLRASWRKQAEIDVNGAVALEAVAKKENISVSAEDFEKRIAEISNKEGDELKNFVDGINPMRRKELERSMRCEKAMDIVAEKAVATDDEQYEVEINENEEDI
ncbi:MAG: trigger factor [Defluviitaleaceae bacterium]|nr:trigger factor [Defluviitaleaceae bacterium]